MKPIRKQTVTEKLINRIEDEALFQLEMIYDQALTDGVRQNKKALREMQAVMDGTPPRWCVTEQQKARWREKRLKEIEKAAKLVESFDQQGIKAGEKAVEIIQAMSGKIYRAAYEETMRALRG